MPGSPSQEGSKPGVARIGTWQLVASRGRVGSNPTPGAFWLGFFVGVVCFFVFVCVRGLFVFWVGFLFWLMFWVLFGLDFGCFVRVL